MFERNINFPDAESKIIDFWRETDAFNRGNELSKDRPKYVFYDGPPFATGLPHYGHILSGTIKDTVGRYYYQKGFHVERRFGWDCHGLPVEYEIDKKMQITDRQQILDMGIDKYNEECRSIVMKYSGEWEETVTRMGRWVDFAGGYRTMDAEFMESTWFIFSQLFKRNKIYRGFKIMPFSTACKTPLSNFEANQNYKDVSDPSVLVAFPLILDSNTAFDGLTFESVSLVAWTTTPWTLPSNCGLIVNKEFQYSVFYINDNPSKLFVMHCNRIGSYFTKFTVLKDIGGSDIVGMQYRQPFDFFEEKRAKGFFRVLTAEFVSDNNGTAIVHCAPAFGEEDYKVFLQQGLIAADEAVPCPVDENGLFTMAPYKNICVKDLDKIILRDIKERILMNSRIVHSYPFCWRSDTPLIYKLVPNWFVRVKESREELLKNNEKINWIPADIKYKRFHNWLASARDWAISRNRFWGTPIPIWAHVDENGQLDYEDLICVGSVEELKSLSGEKDVCDLHRQFIDQIVIRRDNKTYRRIDEVLDCWFESGSMPYSQDHWPFRKDTAESITRGDFLRRDNFPAQFIGEGLDQTRGWFYTLHVISTLLFGEPAFKNVVVNGIVLAEDGKKMSKRLKNYPSPDLIFGEYGADALRVYLISSPVVEADNLRFNEHGVKDILKSLLIPWYNSLLFFMECEDKENDLFMDQWIVDSFSNFNFKIDQAMKAYRLNAVLPAALSFLDDLSNWYIRINRKDLRLGGKLLGSLLKDFSIAMGAFTPFFSEYCYQSVSEKSGEREECSVHHCLLRETAATRNEFEYAKNVIEGIRQIREVNALKLKRPLKNATVTCNDKVRAVLENFKSVIKSECNLLDISFKSDYSYTYDITIKPCFANLNKDRASMKEKLSSINNLTEDDVKKIASGDSTLADKFSKLTVSDFVLEKKFVNIPYSGIFDNFGLILDASEDETIREMTLARDFNSFIQKLRKNNSLKVEDCVGIKLDNPELQRIAIQYYNDLIFENSLYDGKLICTAEYLFETIREKVELYKIQK